jgi:hypothetical protein
MSRRTLDAATEVVKAAEADPTLAPLVEAMDDTGKVEPAHKALRSLPEQPTPDDVAASLEKAEQRMRETSPEVAEAHRAAEFAKAMKGHGRATAALTAEAWAAGLDASDAGVMRAHLVTVRLWLDSWTQALERPALRVVGGGS